MVPFCFVGDCVCLSVGEFPLFVFIGSRCCGFGWIVVFQKFILFRWCLCVGARDVDLFWVLAGPRFPLAFYSDVAVLFRVAFMFFVVEIGAFVFVGGLAVF